jgi:hypothetical protein
MTAEQRDALIKAMSTAQRAISPALDQFYPILYKPQCPWEVSELARVQATMSKLITDLLPKSEEPSLDELKAAAEIYDRE